MAEFDSFSFQCFNHVKWTLINRFYGTSTWHIEENSPSVQVEYDSDVRVYVLINNINK